MRTTPHPAPQIPPHVFTQTWSGTLKPAHNTVERHNLIPIETCLLEVAPTSLSVPTDLLTPSLSCDTVITAPQSVPVALPTQTIPLQTVTTGYPVQLYSVHVEPPVHDI
ncbi:hypothetical protein HanRHA438_Chr16g0787911 [Helianthus annuus]|nr:hypothetical protein HanRHA438_Chr16g0787911 [Helianthus annuus]